MSETMRAAVLYGASDVRLERVPLPTVGPGEVRVRIETALTCGTDAKVYRRGYHARMIQPPAVFGHEFAGVIDEVGTGVSRFQVGERVVAANSAPCGDCFFCRRDQPELCEDLRFLNGAYAEYLTIPTRIVEHNLLKLPDHVAFREAALTEPLACCVKGVEDTGVRAGETVVVLGNGPIGLMMIRLCAALGARVIALGRRAQRLETAGVLGADTVIDDQACEDVVGAVAELTEGRGADRVIECVGRPEAWERAIALTRPGGTCNLFGGCPSASRIGLDTTRLHYDELRLLGSFHHTPRHIAGALELIAKGTITAEWLVNDAVELAELTHALERMGTRSNLLKAEVRVR